MSEEQIKEARERLSISVEGETSTSVPLEAFDDMVSTLRSAKCPVSLLQTATLICFVLLTKCDGYGRLCMSWLYLTWPLI